MITDLLKLTTLLDSWGVTYRQGVNENGNIDVTLEAKVHEKVIGYTYFITTYTFTTGGTFQHIGVWDE